MARVDVADSWYHVIARGQRRQKIFFSKEDRERYLKELEIGLRRYDGHVGAYCLMTNHVHLLIRRGRRPLGRIIQQVHGAYGRYLNRRHRLVGYVFQGRFKSYLILDDRYLAALVRYVHLNPVGAGICRRPEQYSWSSDAFYRGSRARELEGLVRVPGYEGVEGTRTYRQLISETEQEDFNRFEQYIGEQRELRAKDRRSRGKDSFVKERRGYESLKDRVRKLMLNTSVGIEVLRSRRRTADISMLRQRIMAKLYDEGFPPVEIAGVFDKTPSAVIRAVERIPK